MQSLLTFFSHPILVNVPLPTRNAASSCSGSKGQLRRQRVAAAHPSLFLHNNGKKTTRFSPVTESKNHRYASSFLARSLDFLVEVVQHVVQHEVVAVLVLRHAAHELGPVPADRPHRLQHVHLPVLDHLLDAGVGRAVHPATAVPVLADDNDGAVVAALPPPLHHVHELDEGVGGRGHLVVHRPARQLEELHAPWWRFHARHQLRQRDDLFIDTEDPRSDVAVFVVRDVVDGEHGAILFRVAALRPKGRVTLRVLGWDAQHYHGGGLVVVHHGPEVTLRVLQRPLRDDVLPGLGVSVHEHGVDVVGEIVPLE